MGRQRITWFFIETPISRGGLGACSPRKIFIFRFHKGESEAPFDQFMESNSC